MSPYIHHIEVLSLLKTHKLLTEAYKLMVVVAGRKPPHIIFRHVKAGCITKKNRTLCIFGIKFGTFYNRILISCNSCILYAKLGSNITYSIIACTIREGHSMYRISHDFFKIGSVIKNLMDNFNVRTSADGRMCESMYRNFVTGI